MQVYLIVAHIKVRHLRLLELEIQSWNVVLGFYVDSSSYFSTL